MTTNDIRKQYLMFFQEQGHTILPSASLLPEHDPTTLFTGSGMQPMVPFLLGQTHPAGTRLTDSQKCFRSQDLEEVGDNRHTTFFEMLGNWSLGDYFKKEQIHWMFTFLTDRIGLDPARIYVTCFRGDATIGISQDEEAAMLWKGLFEAKGVEALIKDEAEIKGMQGGRIFYYPAKKNWWSRAGVPENMPVGEPGGPDTEMFWDFGEALGLHEQSAWKAEPCHVNCDCGRFMEIGNNVFMQYKKTETGFELLPQLNVDFGGGLERIAAAHINNPDVFRIDLFDRARLVLEQLSQKTYGAVASETYAFRVILDHIRAATFLIGDAAFPANKDQGYFTRRLIRRAVRYANKLQIHEQCARAVAAAYIETYQEAYPNLHDQSEMILKAIAEEEGKFRKAMARAQKEFEKEKTLITALVDSLVQGTATDETTHALMKKAFDLFQTHGLPLEIFFELIDAMGAAGTYSDTVFMSVYDTMFTQHQQLSRQASEKKFKGGLADHSDMSVKYHTATHLLHAALKKVLGDHVEQKGSNITPERLRFDFSHPDKLTDEQKKQVEDLVNAAIATDYPVSWQEMPIAKARELQAIGLFDDQYGEVVKVYTVGDPTMVATADPSAPTFSREFCGGPHVEHTGVLGKFSLVKEEACSAGIRRIKAVLV